MAVVRNFAAVEILQFEINFSHMYILSFTAFLSRTFWNTCYDTYIITIKLQYNLEFLWHYLESNEKCNHYHDI